MTDREWELLREFKGYCRNASIEQVRGIYEKEKKAAESGDPFRKMCAFVAKTEMSKKVQ